nr:unnamed protein product [Digitaria exilis]
MVAAAAPELAGGASRRLGGTRKRQVDRFHGTAEWGRYGPTVQWVVSPGTGSASDSRGIRRRIVCGHVYREEK